MSSKKLDLVKKLIESDFVVIFSKTFCPHCNVTKNIFEDIDQNFTAIELDRRKDCEEIQKVLKRITGARTVPRVFVNGVFIGGASDVKELYENGDLLKYLNNYNRT
ncbi:hypothetical protein Zmor_024786 [Zophobas morio]|mgnify:CR=1 FL=1|uniref:Glutaredoxin-2, mitochondrial n=1 Tax=Zophobas morio TaxID=2755281 RepID=A0AA38M8V2_9CUCU|nr:hypothetical protein Zmor_024786 [Zophobas morio]